MRFFKFYLPMRIYSAASDDRQIVNKQLIRWSFMTVYYIRRRILKSIPNVTGSQCGTTYYVLFFSWALVLQSFE